MKRRTFYTTAFISLSALTAFAFILYGINGNKDDALIGSDINESQRREANIITESRPLTSEGPVNKNDEIDVVEVNTEKDISDNWCNYWELSQSAKSELDQAHQDWSEDMGYFYDKNRDYFYYTEDAILELSKGGDLRAMDIILRSDKFNDEQKNWAAEEMLINGGTGWAITYLAMQASGEKTRHEYDGNHQAAKRNAIELISLAQFSAMRGDFIAYGTRYIGKLTKYKLDEADIAEIEMKSKLLFDRLNSARADRNIDPFALDYPLAMKKFLATEVSKLKEKGGWISALLESNDFEDCESYPHLDGAKVNLQSSNGSV